MDFCSTCEVTLENERAVLAVHRALEKMKRVETFGGSHEIELEREIRRLKGAKMSLSLGTYLPERYLRQYKYGWTPPNHWVVSFAFEGISSTELASELGVTTRSIVRWKCGEVEIPYSPWRLFLKNRKLTASDEFCRMIHQVEEANNSIDVRQALPQVYHILIAIEDCATKEEVNNLIHYLDQFYESIDMPEHLSAHNKDEVRGCILEMDDYAHVSEDDDDYVIPYLKEVEAIQQALSQAIERTSANTSFWSPAVRPLYR